MHPTIHAAPSSLCGWRVMSAFGNIMKTMNSNYSDSDIRRARDRFEHLLTTNASENQFQKLFSECPFILSSSLPFRLSPQEIIPLGRPGFTEPDFIYFGSDKFEYPIYGVIEIKRPDTSVLVSPRKNVVIFSAHARTAIEQCEKYSTDLKKNIRQRFDSTIMVGNEACNFIIMGVTNSIAAKLLSEWQINDISRQLPRNCRILPYDTVYKQFERSIPPKYMILTPLNIVDMLNPTFGNEDTKNPPNILPHLRKFVESAMGVKIKVSIDDDISGLSKNKKLLHWNSASFLSADEKTFYIKINPRYLKAPKFLKQQELKYMYLKFTVAHEIAHLYYNHLNSSQQGDLIEAEADSFASHLLEKGEILFINYLKNLDFENLFQRRGAMPDKAD